MAKKLTEKELDIISRLKSGSYIPSHIAIIMDGNGRWAKRRGMPRVAGHQKGVQTVRNIVETCAELGVKYLTLYTFSTENWKRPKDEVSTLMRLIVKSLQTETNELLSNNIKLTTIGDLSLLPDAVRQELNDATTKTAQNTRLVLNLALSYSGRWDIINAVKTIAEKCKTTELEVSQINESLLNSFLSTSQMPEPELMIRTGGEFRVSNFLLWQIAYSEIYVTNVLWPDFSPSALCDAINDFRKRERRFGMVSEQISSMNENKALNENN